MPSHLKQINWAHNYTIQDYNNGLLNTTVCKSWRVGGIRFSCLVNGQIMLKETIWTKENARLSEESSEKAIDSFPRRYVFGTLASSTTPCALHGNTTSLRIHITDQGFFF